MSIFIHYYSTFNYIFKVLPTVLLPLTLFIGIIFADNFALLLTLGSGLTHLLNYLCKNYIFKLFCYLTNTSCERPENARNCEAFEFNDKLSITSGMPSGHAQTIGFVVGFIIIHIYRNMNNLSLNRKKISYFLLIVSMIYMDFTRTYIFGCHTVPQVIVANVIAILTAGLYYKLVERFLIKRSHKISPLLLIPLTEDKDDEVLSEGRAKRQVIDDQLSLVESDDSDNNLVVEIL